MSNAKPQISAAIYLRISSDPTGQQLGVARQRTACVDLCSERGWQPVEYVDNDTSASSGKRRPAYERMLTDVRDGRIGAVVAWDLDRLHRRPIELESFMSLADERHLALATVSGDVDLSTAQGRLTARLKGSVAAHEIEHKRARQRAAAKQKAERGEPQWRNAFGYSPDGSRIPDPETAPLVKSAYASILAGGSITDIARDWNAAGALTRQYRKCKTTLADGSADFERDGNGQPVYDVERRPWTAQQVSNFLRKARNAGLRAHNDVIVGQGNWQPLVDESTWRAAQSVLNAPGRAPGAKSVQKHLLTSVMACGRTGCDGYLSGQWVMQKTGGQSGRLKAGETRRPGQKVHTITYACRKCRGCSVRAEHVEPLLRELVARRLARSDAAELLKAQIVDPQALEMARAQIVTLNRQLEQFAVEHAEGLLTARQVKISSDVVQAKIDKLELSLQDSERMRVFEGIRLGTSSVTTDIEALSPDRYRAVIAAMGTVTVYPVGKGHRPNGERFDPQRIRVTW